MLSHSIDMITFSSASEFAQYLVRQLPARMPVPSLPFTTLRTSGNSRTSATNLASKGEPLSFRQTRENGSGKFKSITVSKATPSGHRQRVGSLTNATTQPARNKAKNGCLIRCFLDD